MCDQRFFAPSFGLKRLTAALLMLLAARTVHAATYYVATTGLDTNAGTLASPFKTIKMGAQQLAAGDTLYIRAGTYNEGMYHGLGGFSFRNGTPSAYTRYAAYPGEEKRVIIKNPQTDLPSPHVVYFSENAAYIELKGLTIDGINNVRGPGINGIPFIPGYGIKGIRSSRIIGNVIRNSGMGLGGGRDSEIIGNEIYGMSDYGMYTGSGDNGLVAGNIFHDTGGYGIHHYESSATGYTVDNWTFRNNIFYRTGRGYDHSLTGDRLRTAPAIIISSGRNNKLYNNVVYDSHGGISVAHYAVDSLIANNTVYGNDSNGITIIAPQPGNGGSINARVSNNIVWGNGGSQISNLSTSTVLQNNLTTVNPNFVNAAGADFHLLSGSPAINAGVNLYSAGVTQDFAGVARPQTGAFEIGAYEYGGSTPPPAFNFSLSNGGNKSVTQGGSVTNSLTATLVSGTAQAVSLSVSGLPTGVTASFSPASCTPNCSSTLTLFASASAATGSATVTVTAAGGGISRTSAFSLTVNVTTPPTPTGPVGWWKLDENTGASAADSSGSGNNGTLTNGPVWTAGRMGSGLAFDGTNDSVTIPHSPSLALAGAFSMAAWVNPAISTTNFKSVMVKNYSHFLYASVKGYCGNGAVLVGFVGSAGTKTACDRNPLPANAWTHLAATNDGSVLRLYRNGVLTSSAAVTGAPVASTGTLQLGASRVSGENFNGKLDDARVYNRALSASEVLALFNAAPSGSVTDINGDGITNVTDIQIAVNQAAGGAACGSGDVNKDGVCNVSDIQLVINKALGL